jgi:hypothetical protein
MILRGQGRVFVMRTQSRRRKRRSRDADPRWTSNENGVPMSDNTLNKALGIMGCDSPWRRRLRARLPLDRVDLAQRVGAFDDDVVEA